MKLLVVGSGGREHALLDRLRRDAREAELFAAPGNAGTARIARNLPIAASDLEALASFAASERVELTVVGPEAPLAAGIVDLFEARRLPIFGPTRAAARIEASKAFAKRLMWRRGVATAPFEIFTEAEPALTHLDSLDPPFVVKASGLAAGKGAIVSRSREEGRTAVRQMMLERRFGDAGAEVVVEHFLEGEELSVFFLTDGERAVPLVPSRDYKRVGERDRGPNTGGMGAYAPAGPSPTGPLPAPGRESDAPGARAKLLERLRREIALPVLEGMAEQGAPYRGLLYCGLMLTVEGPRVVEFNCRFGDPETQVVLPLTLSGLLEPLLAIARRESLGDWGAETAEGAALVTVLASAGYPGSYQKGKAIQIPAHLEEDDALRIYHAGTSRRDGELVTAGGRVLGVVGLGSDLLAAASRCRQGAEAIEFEGKQWRRDIGWHEVEVREVEPAFER